MQKQYARLPQFLKKYFWDADVARITEKNASYVIGRILEHGDVQAVQWLFAHAEKADVEKTLMRRRGFSPRTANFWRIILGINKGKVACLKKSFVQMQKSHWIY